MVDKVQILVQFDDRYSYAQALPLPLLSGDGGAPPSRGGGGGGGAPVARRRLRCAHGLNARRLRLGE